MAVAFWEIFPPSGEVSGPLNTEFFPATFISPFTYAIIANCNAVVSTTPKNFSSGTSPSIRISVPDTVTLPDAEVSEAADASDAIITPGNSSARAVIIATILVAIFI